jgi:hypothetical protein
MATPNQAASELEETSDEREQAARLYVDQLRAFYIHACMFAVGMLVIFAVNLLTNLSAGIAGDWTAWWSAWAFLGWGLGIAVHGLVVRLNRPTPATSSWGQQQIDKVLSR